MKNLMVIVVMLCVSNSLLAQNSEVQKIIFTRDSLFWAGYNTCDTMQMKQFVADDVEFYHDKGGITLGKTALMASIKNNLCSNTNFKTRREAVPGTVNIYELKKGDETYGAIISGEHYFFNTHDGNPEKREGLANFCQLWMLKNGVWKMTRILSYNHHEAPYENARQQVKLPANILAQYKGRYVAPQAGECNVVPEQDGLLLVIGEKKYQLIPQSETMFFTKDRDLMFEFIKNDKGEIIKFIVRENGNIAEEATRK